MLDHSPDWRAPLDFLDHNGYGGTDPEGYARPAKQQRSRTRAGEPAKVRKKLLPRDLRKSKVSQAVSLIIQRQKRRMLAQKRRRGRNRNTQDTGQKIDNPASLGDLALAAELMEMVSSTVTQLQRDVQLSQLTLALHHDHSCLTVPSDPAQLSLLVRGLSQAKHHHEEAIRGLQRYLEKKEQQLLDMQEEMEEHQEEAEAKFMDLTSQLQQQHQVNELLRKQLQETREKLQASTDTVLFLSTNMQQQKKPPPSRLTAALTARVLSRAPRKWLRFFTGFSSYARFQAFLSFLQSGDGAMLAKSCPSQAEVEEEEGDCGEGEEVGQRNGGEELNGEEEEGLTNNGVVHQEKDSNLPAQQAKHTFCPDYEEGEEEEQEATARSVRQRLLAELRGSKQPPSGHRMLGPEDQLLLTLTRLRLGLLLQDLAFRFNVAEATASRIWGHWLGLMQRRLQQVPVRCSQHYISQFQPQHSLCLGPGRELAVLECSDLLFDAPMCRTAVRPKRPQHRSERRQPYRYLWPKRGCALASPEGHLGFCSSDRLQEWEDWAARPERPPPAALPKLPAYLVGDETGVVPAAPVEGTPYLEVLSVRSLTDKVLTFRYLRTIQTQAQGSAVQMDRAWEVCCYLTCLLHRPMGLR
ncbi:hypothetical protein ACEWY4_025348 [Coilia grayii]|uniref:Transposase Helix-turn-helix domain-containing protein n=1 Tax=Coilia grayii TaxID=363190 RepID=A0ABD1IXD6_9TELE